MDWIKRFWFRLFPWEYFHGIGTRASDGLFGSKWDGFRYHRIDRRWEGFYHPPFGDPFWRRAEPEMIEFLEQERLNAS